jgi:hypothetical protein
LNAVAPFRALAAAVLVAVATVSGDTGGTAEPAPNVCRLTFDDPAPPRCVLPRPESGRAS